MTDPDGRRGTISEDQRLAIAGLLIDTGLIGNLKARAELIASVVPGWRWGSDLGGLSRHEAGNVLEALEERRRGVTLP